ncbi:alpha/beta hydrolase family protein [Glutamicibacter uratoxydans]|uniref:alpha/beta hydrolase family protein n=1 Tax=Glutamicibacter uratoxydans TaxID=43667 RepID=UPI003D700116
MEQLTTSGMREQIRIPVTVRDGVIATIYKPSVDPVGVLIVHSATATPQGFYRGFAQYAAATGLLVVTYDYRGTGLSGEARSNAQIRMRDWIQQDIPTVSQWVNHTYPQLPQYALGHSVGGHGVALDYGTDQLTRAVIISSHLANIGSIEDFWERLRVRAVLHWLGPVMSRVLGYMPGQRLGLGENIPAAAMFEWGRWNLKPEYFFDDPSMNAAQRCTRVTTPLLLAGSSDDPWASAAQMDRFASKLVNAPVLRRTVSPQELGATAIGHHGLMRRGIGEPVWDEILHWLRTGEH